MPKVMLDAGHHGKYYNPSPVVDGYYESQMAWDLQGYLKTALERYDIEVGTTRTDIDDDPEVTRRGRKGEGYDLLISLHSNARDDRTKDRVAIYYQVPNKEEYSKVSEKLANILAPILNDTMECKNRWKTAYKRYSMGSNKDYYGVLRGAAYVDCPAMIIEHSYHTNERATRWLMNQKNLATLAKIEAQTIAKFFGIIEPHPLGDVDGDGKVTIKDYVMCKRIVLGTYKPTKDEFRRADVNGDGKVSAVDYAIIKRIALGTKKIDKK